MTSVNPQQTTLQNQYNQIGANLQSTKPVLTAPNFLHDMGLNANLLHNLRNDLDAVINGSVPDRALTNLVAGFQQLLTSFSGGAKEWPADKVIPEGGKFFVKSSDGLLKEITPPKEWPADKGFPEGSKFFVKGSGGLPKEITPAKEWPADKVIPEGGKFFVKGSDGLLKEITPPKERPADKALLEARAAVDDISQAAENLRSGLKPLLSNSFFANSPEQ